MAIKPDTSRGSKLVFLSAFVLANAAIAPDHAHAQTLSCPGSLIFGSYVTCGVSNTATVTPQNARNVTGCLSTGGGPYSRAQCNLNQGFPAANYQISVTATQYSLSNGGGAHMLVDNFQCHFQGTGSTVTGACLHTTSGFFLSMNIGATLHVGASQASGTYSGTFTVNTNFP